eukprot:TRINITY_DN2823_c0_g1_i3.p1 TRINITY_DN2823_c0_g1~~TRINITY_DN2823_c0_g1_i3.p1  ORF type:complete len:236 (+),score=70.87 TRINITY_DN2823_c0_g1_i3:233-940(+)
MSSRRGDTGRASRPNARGSKGGQAHQNVNSFSHNKGSRMTKKIDGLVNTGLCKPCWEKIEWRKKFHKYKPLSTARKCNSCAQKTINKAYHVLCDTCAKKERKCAKCCEVRAVVKSKSKVERERDAELLRMALENMNERERRKWTRKLEGVGGRKDQLADNQEYQAIADNILMMVGALENDDDREVVKMNTTTDDPEVEAAAGPEEEEEGSTTAMEVIEEEEVDEEADEELEFNDD